MCTVLLYCLITVKTGQAYPPRIHYPLRIYYSKVESVAHCRFQIDLCILACVMSREFTREAVMKFLPAQFPWIWRKCLLRNIIHSKIFNLTQYREVLVRYSLLITHTEMPIWSYIMIIIILRHDVYRPITLSYYSQTRSSIPSKNPLMNLFIRKLNLLLVVDFRLISAFFHA